MNGRVSIKALPCLALHCIALRFLPRQANRNLENKSQRQKKRKHQVLADQACATSGHGVSASEIVPPPGKGDGETLVLPDFHNGSRVSYRPSRLFVSTASVLATR